MKCSSCRTEDLTAFNPSVIKNGSGYCKACLKVRNAERRAARAARSVVWTSIRCGICREDLPQERFSPSVWQTGSGYCRKCLHQSPSYRKYNKAQKKTAAYKKLAAKLMRQWKEENPAKLAELRAKRRSYFVDAAVITNRDLKRLFNRQHGKCYYCECLLERDTMHLDHVLALSRGGRHSIGNIVYACPACNMSKNAKLLIEWKVYKTGPHRAVNS